MKFLPVLLMAAISFGLNAQTDSLSNVVFSVTKGSSSADGAVVFPIRMNVFYIGVDNPVRIAAPGVLPKNILATIDDGGTIENKGDGNFVVHVTNVGTCKVSVSAKVGDKIQFISASTFRCKRVPDPVATVGGRLRGGNITAGTLKAEAGIIAMFQNFDFELRISIQGFKMTHTSGGTSRTIQTNGPAFSNEMKNVLNTLRPGDMVIFTDILCTAPNNEIRKLNDIVFTII